MRKHKYAAKKVIKYFSQFAIHVWLIVLLANILLVYTFHFYLHAAAPPPSVSSLGKQAVFKSLDAPADGDVQTSPEPTDFTPTMTPEPTEFIPPSPNGPLIGLSFSIPGIGSGGGNMKPLHPVRSVTLFLYPTGVNSLDKKIRPLNTIKTKAYYDTNPDSPTYTSFINPKIDLGAKVADRDYQILIKTDKSFISLYKDKPDSVGGTVFGLEKRPNGEEYPSLPHQTMIMGDLSPPEGDNVVNLADYNILINCYQMIRGTPTCPNPFAADINDDGAVDGLDYNVMVLSNKALQDQGITVPKLVVPPTGTQVSRLSYITDTPKKPVPTKVPVTVTKAAKKSGGVGGIIVFFLFLLILGAGGFVMYLKNSTVKALVNALIHRSDGPPAPPSSSTGTPQSGQTAPTSTSATPAVGQETTKPAEEASSSKDAAQSAPVDTGKEAKPVPSTGSSSSSTTGEAKEYFVKKQAEDETKTGFWLTLTDDNGPSLAHYKGTEVADGFAHIKGEMKTENGKTFMEISEIVPEA